MNWLIHYPVWELEAFGGGFWIALIATIHVYVAHFAVGAGLFLVLTEMKAYRENSSAILDYTKKHSKLFLLISMVFGSITGVGIWFIISILSPAATSVLIHEFIFAWATEWVFFLGEIITLFVYFYAFDKMEKRDHLRVGWLYFGFGWMSLFVINGIVAFMLTPGDWLQTRNFWDGFFNPSFLPSLFFRTAMAFMLAGLFGFITAVYLKEEKIRESMTRYCTLWLIIPFLYLILSAKWYLSYIPEPFSPEILPFIKAFLWISPIIFIGGILMALRVPVQWKKSLAYLLIVIGLMYMGSFEWIREAGRRPYLIYGYQYSNGVLVKDADAVKQSGVLASARWAKYHEITEDNKIEAGRDLFKFLCSSCHSVGGMMKDIRKHSGKYSLFGMESALDGMGKLNSYMPPFMGNDAEKKALAEYIVNVLNKNNVGANNYSPLQSPTPVPPEIPSFDPDKDEYVLLAWNGKGMHCMSDSDRYFTLSPAGSDIYAMLIKRGASPERMGEGIEISYRIEEGFGNIAGRMKSDEKLSVYAATALPVIPYKNNQDFNPYPLMSIDAKDAEGKLLASTKIAVPVSTELGCKACHGGNWGFKDTTGISAETAKDILRSHDKFSRTNLLKMAENGQPKSCSECHSDQSKNLNLSASIHGFHANFLPNRNAEACTVCHSISPESFTKGYRDIHHKVGEDCTNCHGKLEDHALSVLASEKNAGKYNAGKLMKGIAPRGVEKTGDIAPRKARINAPDCLSCHVNFNAPETDTAPPNSWNKEISQLYRNSKDNAGLMCAACHSAAHGLYPSENSRDNIVPMQYQKNPYPIGANKNCKVCHTMDMEDEAHHPHSLGMFRNVWQK